MPEMELSISALMPAVRRFTSRETFIMLRRRIATKTTITGTAIISTSASFF